MFISLSYVKDRIWQMAKAKYRGTKYENNWVYIITYYNHCNGKTLSMYCTPEENKSCRVLCKLDNKDKVLTVDENNKFHFYSVNALLGSHKVFSYSTKVMTNKRSYHLNEDTVFGSHDFNFYAEEV